MKKLLGLVAILLALCLVISCASTNAAASGAKEEVAKFEETPYVMKDDVIEGSKGIDDAEAAAMYNLADAKVDKWSADGGKNYMNCGDLWSKIQYEDGGDWQADLMGKYFESIDVGDGDKIVAFNMPMKAHYGWIQNFSNQGANPKAISKAVWKMKMYIPEKYCDPLLTTVPQLRFQVRDTSWGIKYLKGDLDKIPVSTIGAGWHTLIIDFANGTYDFGTVKGTFEAPSIRQAFAFELQFDGSKISEPYPFYFDWISIEGLE